MLMKLYTMQTWTYTMIIGKLTNKLFMLTKYASHCCQVKALNVQVTHTQVHKTVNTYILPTHLLAS